MYLMHKDNAELAEIMGSPVALGATPDKIVLDPLARFAYVLKREAKEIGFYRFRSAITAAFTEMLDYGSPMKVDMDVTDLAIDNEGRFLVMTDAAKNTLHVFSMFPANGSLSPAKSAIVNMQATPLALAFHPDGKSLWALAEKQISAFAYNSLDGSLKKLETSLQDLVSHA